MNQPLTVTLTQKAPLTSLLLGMVTLIALIVLPFWRCYRRIIRWRYQPIP